MRYKEIENIDLIKRKNTLLVSGSFAHRTYFEVAAKLLKDNLNVKVNPSDFSACSRLQGKCSSQAVERRNCVEEA